MDILFTFFRWNFLLVCLRSCRVRCFDCLLIGIWWGFWRGVFVVGTWFSWGTWYMVWKSWWSFWVGRKRCRILFSGKLERYRLLSRVIKGLFFLLFWDLGSLGVELFG